MKKSQGTKAELCVARHMESRGFKLLEHNYRTQTGEIDLVMQNKDLIVFVEVKQRTRQWFDHTDLITLAKQKKVASAAYVYINSLKDKNRSFRFDVALLEGALDNHTITYIENAFIPDRYI